IEECLSNQYTHKSCKKVFCNPWERCVEGVCRCKLPYQCPKNGTAVCSTSGRQFQTYCQLKSYECQQPAARFLNNGNCVSGETFEVSLGHGDSSVLRVKPVNRREDLFVCDSEWTMNEANVACRHLGFELGAQYYQSNSNIIKSTLNSSQCLQITCRGLETSLAECYTVEKSRDRNEGFVSLDCYENVRDCSAGEFHCVNSKCVSLTNTCDGINDCGDLSDELCCKACRGSSFHCRSNICIPSKNVCNKEADCLTEEDEAQLLCAGFLLRPFSLLLSFFISILIKRKRIKTFLPQINCGITNRTLTRRKRIIGGKTAKKGEFPWQVAIRETGSEGATVYCGGVYIGGCWVLTAAHCVRANRVHLYRIWIGLLDTIRFNKETDTYQLKQLIIHEKYNATTYENDIALMELKSSGKGECSLKYTTPACIPWSEYMFKSGDTCKVSGWGLEKGYTKQYVLKWGNVNLFQNCSELYPGRFFKEMACTYDGSIDSCKGDSGGPLVCFDAENVAYVWGVVSWGENCGEPGHPGVYTKVASYYDWISRHVTRSLISRYNV
ncbi:CFAI factor, partial [Nothocercus nigrocapillus]|nr:CFAI factor [Nothocercus nigrocapillus]